ncbi:MAG: P1 family peptidase, partial [Deltaproteobacteria bacterium]|nr:P1 family peptidase [Deltaproteobacteria bacterium]
FGLNAAAGVSFYLEEKGIGLDLGVAKLPIVPTSVIYDLSFMDPQARPTPEMAYEACLEASSAPVVQGCVGVGTGATSGKLRGMENATKSGIGSSMVEGSNGIKMGSIVVANPFGDILGENGAIVAGARDGKSFINSFQSIAAGETRSRFGSPSNTTLCLLVTDAGLDKIMAMQVARMAGHGLSKHISPFNTPFDGDMVFCLSIGEKQADPLHLGIIAARAAREALLSAVRHAHGLGGIPAAGDL